MKAYKIANLKLEIRFSSKPNHDNYDHDDWRKFILGLVNENPNGLLKAIKKRLPNFLNWISTQSGNSDAEKIYLFIHKTPSNCICGRVTSFLGMREGFRKYCSVNCSQYDEARIKKVKQTIMKNHGCEFPLQSANIRNKGKKTCIQKYGVENPYAAEIVKQKIKKINLEKYGVENPSSNPIIAKKMSDTWITNNRNTVAGELIKQKTKQTCLEKYGVENPLQNPIILAKNQKAQKRLKPYIFKSGKIVLIQGYENIALDNLVKKFDEDDIVVSYESHLRFQYQLDEKSRFYFPDILIKSINKIIEVKSLWTLSKWNILKELEEKRLSCIAAGYDHEMWICDKKKVLKIINGAIDEQSIKI